MSPTDLAQLYAIAVAGLAGVVIPALVDLVTKSHLANGAKAAIATGLAAVAGALSAVTITPTTRWQTLVLSILAAFFSTFTAHQTGYSDPLQRATATFGLGAALPALPAPPAPVQPAPMPMVDNTPAPPPAPVAPPTPPTAAG